MGQQRFCPDKQQYNNAFPVHAVTIEEIEKKTLMEYVSNMV